MQNSPKTRRVLILLVPALFIFTISEAAAQRRSVEAIRAQCFAEANEAADTVMRAGTGAVAERNARGYSAYRDCVRRHGIRP
jgi:hypothetical protein